jgi:hypothetical protein
MIVSHEHKFMLLKTTKRPAQVLNSCSRSFADVTTSLCGHRKRRDFARARQRAARAKSGIRQDGKHYRDYYDEHA